MPEILELIFRAVLEALVLGGVLLFVGWKTVGHITPPHRRIRILNGKQISAVILITVLTTVHMLDRWQYDFPNGFSPIPFTRFAMYSIFIPEKVESSYSWELKTEVGWRELNVSNTFNSMSVSNLSSRMMHYHDRLLANPGDVSVIAELELWADVILLDVYTSSESSGEWQTSEIRFSSVSGDENRSLKQVLWASGAIE